MIYLSLLILYKNTVEALKSLNFLSEKVWLNTACNLYSCDRAGLFGALFLGCTFMMVLNFCSLICLFSDSIFLSIYRGFSEEPKGVSSGTLWLAAFGLFLA